MKPNAEDASLGIDQGSVVTDHAALAGRVAMLRRRFACDVLIEAYLPGPEYNVGVLGLREPIPLAVAEVVYAPKPGDWPILTYAAKWDIGSAEDLASPIRCPAAMDCASTATSWAGSPWLPSRRRAAATSPGSTSG